MSGFFIGGTMNNFVYICYQQSSDLKENICRGKLYKQYILEEGYYPVSPSIECVLCKDMSPGEKMVRDNVEFETLEQCGQVWVFGDIINDSMQEKIDMAQRLRMPVEYIPDWECDI